MGGCTVVALLVLPWWRNHALLIDFFDYGLVMSAVGRMRLGERPYVDFITPIQTLQFLTGVIAEWIAGPRLIALTYTSLVFSLASFAGLTALLWRKLGLALALLIASTVVISTSSQHTIVWYNAMAVVWLTIVVASTADTSGGESKPLSQLGLVSVALWLGGMTKISFQAAALAFAITFTVLAALRADLPWRRARFRIYCFLLFGIVAPVATEMAITGASLDQWLANVVILPAQFRTTMLSQIATAKFFLQTPHDYYHPLFFKFAGAWGITLIATVVGVVIWQLRSASAQRRAMEAPLLIILGVGAAISSAVLLATNMDIAYISAAVPLVLVTGIAIAFPSSNSAHGQQWLRGTITVAALSLLIPAWFAAWSGTRALWGHEQLVRSEMVTADDLPPRFAYLRGMKILPTLHADLRALDESLHELARMQIPQGAIYFTHATEWLVRAVPEARYDGLPLWMARGTTFSDDDTYSIAERLEHGFGNRIIFSFEGWNYWSAGLQALVTERYDHRVVGHRLHMYTHREPPGPLRYATNTQSNLYVKDFTPKMGAPEVVRMANSLFLYGGNHSQRVDVKFGLFRLEGQLAGELRTSGPTAPSNAVFRIFAREGGRLTDVLWQEAVTVSPAAPIMLRPFSISPGGRPVTMTVSVPEGAPAIFGWRKLQTEHAGTPTKEMVRPMDDRLARRTLPPDAMYALFGDAANSVADPAAFGGELRTEKLATGSQVVCHGPNELWFYLAGPAVHVSGEYTVRAATSSQARRVAGIRVAVIAYKAGRFDIMHQREFPPAEPRDQNVRQTFDAWLPEGTGWVGLVTQSDDGAPASDELVSWGALRIF